MTGSRLRVLLPAIAGLLILAVTAPVSAGEGAAPRITKEDAKSVLGNPEVIYIDVRHSRDWEPSKSKIKGAVREDLADMAVWADKYPKEKTLIIYCA